MVVPDLLPFALWGYRLIALGLLQVKLLRTVFLLPSDLRFGARLQQVCLCSLESRLEFLSSRSVN